MSVAAEAKAVYETELKELLEADHRDEFVAIEPAFDGHLVYSHELIERLNLVELAETEAILADGSKVTLNTFVCFVDWFAARVPLQVIANDGRFPLLGTGLLER